MKLIMKNMRDLIPEAILAAVNLLLPKSCLICGEKLLQGEKQLCLSCLSALPLTYFWTQARNPMADIFNEKIESALEDGIITDKEQYAYACALFFYNDDSEYRHITHHIKYKGDIPCGRYFGRLLGYRLSSGSHFCDIDLIIPVPLHWFRRWKRGYNQAEAIAAGLAESLGVEMKATALSRTRYTRTQTRVEVSLKEANVKNAFRMRRKDLPAIRQARHILLVDDIFTSGSTLMACFMALRAALPSSVRISVATLGFVGCA